MKQLMEVVFRLVEDYIMGMIFNILMEIYQVLVWLQMEIL